MALGCPIRSVTSGPAHPGHGLHHFSVLIRHFLVDPVLLLPLILVSCATAGGSRPSRLLGTRPGSSPAPDHSSSAASAATAAGRRGSHLDDCRSGNHGRNLKGGTGRRGPGSARGLTAGPREARFSKPSLEGRKERGASFRVEGRGCCKARGGALAACGGRQCSEAPGTPHAEDAPRASEAARLLLASPRTLRRTSLRCTNRAPWPIRRACSASLAWMDVCAKSVVRACEESW